MLSVLTATLATQNLAAGLGTNNRGRYSKIRFDARLALAARTTDDAARQRLLAGTQRIAMEDVAVVPLHQVNTWALRGGLTVVGRANESALAFDVKRQPWRTSPCRISASSSPWIASRARRRAIRRRPARPIGRWGNAPSPVVPRSRNLTASPAPSSSIARRSRAKAAMLRALEASGNCIGLHMHPWMYAYSRYEGKRFSCHFGDLTEADATALLSEAATLFHKAMGRHPLWFRSGTFSAK